MILTLPFTPRAARFCQIWTLLLDLTPTVQQLYNQVARKNLPQLAVHFVESN